MLETAGFGAHFRQGEGRGIVNEDARADQTLKGLVERLTVARGKLAGAQALLGDAGLRG